MRTTLDIDTRLLRQARKAAAERGIPLRLLVEECLATALRTQAARSHNPVRLRWKVTAGAAAPGVDFSDRDRLYEVMEVQPARELTLSPLEV